MKLSKIPGAILVKHRAVFISLFHLIRFYNYLMNLMNLRFSSAKSSPS